MRLCTIARARFTISPAISASITEAEASTLSTTSGWGMVIASL
jgi:hypothetical protein